MTTHLLQVTAQCIVSVCAICQQVLHWTADANAWHAARCVKPINDLMLNAMLCNVRRQSACSAQPKDSRHHTGRVSFSYYGINKHPLQYKEAV